MDSSIEEIISALKKEVSPNPPKVSTQAVSEELLGKFLATNQPLCYADFVLMPSTKHNSVTYLSRIYCQKGTICYEQKYDIPTFQFVYSPAGIEFSRILADNNDVGGKPPTGIVRSTAMTAAIKQKRKALDYDLATVARISKKAGVFCLDNCKQFAANDDDAAGIYCVYLHTLALVCNFPLGNVERTTSLEKIKQLSSELEKKLQPLINMLLA